MFRGFYLPSLHSVSLCARWQNETSVGNSSNVESQKNLKYLVRTIVKFPSRNHEALKGGVPGRIIPKMKAATSRPSTRLQVV